MILKDLIGEVNSLIDHNPDIATHTNHIVRLINRHYESVCSQAPWRFLQRRDRRTLYADVEGSTTNTATGLQGSAVVEAAGSTTFDAQMVGQLFKGPDGVEMRIKNVDVSNNKLILETDYAGTGFTASASWSIQFDRIFLNKDCVDFLGIVMRDEYTGGQTDRRIQYIDPRMEEEAILDLTESGDTVFITDIQGVEVDSQGLVLSASTTATTSTLTVGNTYEYCATFEYFGLESAPSAVVSSSITNQAYSITLTLSTPPSTFSATHRQNFYRRDATRKGGWWYIGTNGPTSSGSVPTTFTDSGAADDFSRPLYEQLPRAALAVWRRPSSDTTVEVRYHKRPHRLVGDTDSPEMPAQYHVILVYMALSDLYNQYGMGNLAGLYSARADQKIVDMRRKYLDRTDKIYRRKIFAGTGIGGGYLYQDPVKT